MSPGDVIYIVHYRAREIYVGARLLVGQLLSQDEAEAHFGNPGWDADDHVLALEGTEQRLVPDRMVARDLLRRLEFIRPDGARVGLKFDQDGAAHQQTLRSLRELSQESAFLLDEVLGG